MTLKLVKPEGSVIEERSSLVYFDTEAVIDDEVFVVGLAIPEQYTKRKNFLVASKNAESEEATATRERKAKAKSEDASTDAYADTGESASYEGSNDLITIFKEQISTSPSPHRLRLYRPSSR
ncbi:hypothetical protein WN943_016379 [Citrus x changshan-huyou]